MNSPPSFGKSSLVQARRENSCRLHFLGGAANWLAPFFSFRHKIPAVKTEGGFAMDGDLGMIYAKVGKLQEQMGQIREELAQLRVEGAAGDGAVRAVANGLGEIKEVILDPRIIDLENLGELQSMLLTAVNQSLAEARETAGTFLNKATDGMAGMVSDFLGGSNLF
jgi:hypothetical protein